jgi:hypothetical protein
MNEIRIEKNLDQIVLYFGTEQKAINAYTLASTLVSLADAIKESNLQINPGYDIDVLISDLGSGSFKAVIKAIYTSAKNLFSKNRVEAVVLSILASFLYDHFLATKPNVIVNVSPEYVVVEQGTDRVIVQKDVYDHTKEIEKNQPKFAKNVSKAMQTISNDPAISSIAIIPTIDSEPTVSIPKDSFDSFIIEDADESPSPDDKTEEMRTTLQITRAILENNKRRKWEFLWNGVRIPAPVLDNTFYHRFEEHLITIAPGDTLDVLLKVYQRKMKDINVYENYKYEVIQVFPTQDQNTKDMFEGGSDGK